MKPIELLNSMGTKYPNAWKLVETFRDDRDSLGGWPNWCFLPMGGFHAIVSQGHANPQNIGASVADVAILSAVGIWRYTQGVYRYTPKLFESLSETITKGEMPTEVLYRLPEWCVYIETPETEEHGFFAHLEYDQSGRTELRFLILPKEGEPYPLILHIGSWTVTEAIDRMVGEAARQGGVNKEDLSGYTEKLSAHAHKYVSLLLYLCSEEPDIEKQENELPKRPRATRTKKGWRLFPAKKPRVWDIGNNIEEDLSWSDGVSGGTVSPHLRRAHWHGFWTGPKSGDRKFIYKWLPPTVVAGKSEDE